MNTQLLVGRRAFLTGGACLSTLALAGCATTQPGPVAEIARPIPANVLAMYGPLPDEKFPVPAVDIARLDPKYYRQEVADPTGERPGTIVVDTPNRFLYLVGENGRALRYGVGIGREGFAWSGKGTIAYKRKWPTWTPPAEMIAREPALEIYRHGQPPGLDNALGARALYIFENGKDTLYRLHGSMDVTSIGRAVSSGCVRLLFQDVIDLYNRVPDGTVILVQQ